MAIKRATKINKTSLVVVAALAGSAGLILLYFARAGTCSNVVSDTVNKTVNESTAQPLGVPGVQPGVTATTPSQLPVCDDAKPNATPTSYATPYATPTTQSPPPQTPTNQTTTTKKPVATATKPTATPAESTTKPSEAAPIAEDLPATATTVKTQSVKGSHVTPVIILVALAGLLIIFNWGRLAKLAESLGLNSKPRRK